uniref:Uncharacterized protein n=1 Tax=Rhizophora mucronata TaxID=61149 RepID=A0A2P2NED6_RHIMU
MRNFRKRQVRG